MGLFSRRKQEPETGTGVAFRQHEFRNLWCDYAADEQVDDAWFFYKATFIVAITDEGRGVWDVSGGRIGFKQPA